MGLGLVQPKSIRGGNFRKTATATAKVKSLCLHTNTYAPFAQPHNLLARFS